MLATVLALLVFVAVHVFVGQLHLSNLPRSRWLSLAGGVSVTYIFLHVLPEFAEYAEVVEQHEAFTWLEYHVYSFALIGLVTFYTLERLAKRSRESDREPDNHHEERLPSIFWIHMASFCVYNFLIGYLLTGERAGGLNLVYYVVAMAFHFVVNDYGLYDHYRELYERRGRWLVVGALILGWAIGQLTELPELYLAAIFSFIAGGVIMNVLKEELPEERRSSLTAFLGGVVAYAVLLAAT